MTIPRWQERQTRRRAAKERARALRRAQEQLVERVEADDAAFFERHPGITQCSRRYVPGEFPERSQEIHPDTMVVVSKVPGFSSTRLRMPSDVRIPGNYGYVYFDANDDLMDEDGVVYFNRRTGDSRFVSVDEPGNLFFDAADDCGKEVTATTGDW